MSDSAPSTTEATTVPAIHPARIRQILDTNNGSRIRTWLSICSRCGLCASSCFVYKSNDDDVTLSPAYKFKSTLGELFRKRGEVDRRFLEHCHDVAWTKCTTCKRCSQFCPFGIDVAVMISLVRQICYSQGMAPPRLLEFTENCRKSGNHMDLPAQELIDTCDWMMEEVEDEYANVTIPIDQPNVKYMYTINPREPVFYPQELALAATVLSLAEESWTMPTFGWDCTNLPMFTGDKAVAGQQVENVYEQARKLGAEQILITECGHAYRSMVYEGPYLAGYPDGLPPVPVKHFVELLYEYLRDGRIRIDPDKRLTKPVTYQDPCNISRNGGLSDIARELIGFIATDFRDMNPNRDHNHCCGGGGGILPAGPDFKPQRIQNGRLKAEQVKATGAEIVIAPCHNCFDQISDLNEEHDLGVEVLSFKEILMEMIIVPDKFKLADAE